MEVEWTRIAAYAVCRDPDGRVLLTRFSRPGHREHGRWTMPGGGMEWGETAHDTAHREVFEETGLTVTLGCMLGVFSRWITAEESIRGEPGHSVGVIFEATGFSGELRTSFDGLDSTDAAAWFSIDEIRELRRVELVDFAIGLSRPQPNS